MSQQLPPDFAPFQSMPKTPLQTKKRAGVRMLILTLILICAVAVLLNESVLKIRNVAVVGNDEITWEEIVRMAGLDQNISYFAVNENKIREGINANRYLVYEGLTKEFPGSLTLYVKERKSAANVQVMGVMYLLDEEGMVLERLGSTQPDGTLITVTGFQAKEVRLGHQINPGTQAQLEVYMALMEEIQLQNYQDQVSELNLSNPDSLYLVTVDGYTAHLGDGTELRAKLGTLRGVVAKLREMGKYGGVIEASVPAVATYTPVEM